MQAEATNNMGHHLLCHNLSAQNASTVQRWSPASATARLGRMHAAHSQPTASKPRQLAADVQPPGNRQAWQVDTYSPRLVPCAGLCCDQHAMGGLRRYRHGSRPQSTSPHHQVWLGGAGPHSRLQCPVCHADAGHPRIRRALAQLVISPFDWHRLMAGAKHIFPLFSEFGGYAAPAVGQRVQARSTGVVDAQRKPAAVMHVPQRDVVAEVQAVVARMLGKDIALDQVSSSFLLLQIMKYASCLLCVHIPLHQSRASTSQDEQSAV